MLIITLSLGIKRRCFGIESRAGCCGLPSREHTCDGKSCISYLIYVDVPYQARKHPTAKFRSCYKFSDTISIAHTNRASSPASSCHHGLLGLQNGTQLPSYCQSIIWDVGLLHSNAHPRSVLCHPIRCHRFPRRRCRSMHAGSHLAIICNMALDEPSCQRRHHSSAATLLRNILARVISFSFDLHIISAVDIHHQDYLDALFLRSTIHVGSHCV